MTTIPPAVQQMMHQSWADIAPYFEELLATSLTAANLHEWLTDWTNLTNAANEAGSRLHVTHTLDTTDKEAEQAFYRFIEDISPNLRRMDQQLNRKLVESGLEPEGFAIALRNIRTEIEIFREDNLPLLVQEQKLGSEYNKIIGAQTVQWQGDEKTVLQMEALYQEPDRALREAAFHLVMARQLQDREAINANFGKLLELRQQIAQNAGFTNYRDYKWKQRQRHDYTPEDCFRFHAAIEEVVVPAASKIYAKHKKLKGLETLRPYDVYSDPYGLPGLKPFQSIEDFISRANAILGKVDSQFGHYFETMRNEELLDLENRKGKAPGGYCTSFDVVKLPFIFMNAVGIHDNVDTLLHEAGHAFHVFETNHLPYVQQLEVPLEFAEVASMSMELLSGPYLDERYGGYYSSFDTARARIEHLERLLRFWPYMAIVDAFQHWVYANPHLASNPAHCDTKWGELQDRFIPDVDYTGYEDYKVTGWHRKQHIHRSPFYYIEYGLAQLGAVQVWRNSLSNQAEAIALYRKGLALGSLVTLPELFNAAGAKLAFDVETLGEAVDLVMRTIDELEAQLNH